MKLTPEQLKHFDEEGYLFFPNYFSPEEIDAILSATQARPELLAYWLKHVPRNLKEILAAQGRTAKR